MPGPCYFVLKLSDPPVLTRIVPFPSPACGPPGCLLLHTAGRMPPGPVRWQDAVLTAVWPPHACRGPGDGQRQVPGRPLRRVCRRCECHDRCNHQRLAAGVGLGLPPRGPREWGVDWGPSCGVGNPQSSCLRALSATSLLLSLQAMARMTWAPESVVSYLLASGAQNSYIKTGVSARSAFVRVAKSGLVRRVMLARFSFALM
jgi:hypothetical protein